MAVVSVTSTYSILRTVGDRVACHDDEDRLKTLYPHILLLALTFCGYMILTTVWLFDTLQDPVADGYLSAVALLTFSSFVGQRALLRHQNAKLRERKRK